jgi:hypothetical protein
MSDRFDTDYLEVGDSLEGGAIEQSYFISSVMAAGGEVEVDGDIVRIIQLPKKEAPKAKASMSEKPIEKTPVAEEPKKADPEVAIAPKPGPKPKAPVASKKTEV